MACTILICTLIYMIGRPLDKDDLIKHVETAFQQKDSAALSKVLTSSDPNLHIDETNTELLMNYLHENPEYMQSLLAILQEQSNYYDEQSSVSASDGTSAEKIEGFLTLRQQKNSILPDTYSIEIDPVYMTISTNEEATIKVNGEKMTETTRKSNEKKVGPLLPGEYKVEATAKQKDKEIKKTEIVTLWNTDEEVTIDLTTEDIGLSN